MKRLLFVPTLCAMGLFLFGVQSASAECITQTGPAQSGSSPYYESLYGVSSGAWVNVFAKTAADTCASDRTSISAPPYLTDKGSSSKSVTSTSIGAYDIDITATANASASVSSLSVSSSVVEYNSNLAIASATGHVVDLIYINYPGYDPANPKYVSVNYCSEYTSQAAFSGYARSIFGITGLKWTSTGGTGNITHYYAGQICHTGEIKITGALKSYALSLKTFTTGSVDVDPVEIILENGSIIIVNVPTREGLVTASVNLGAFPSGGSCYSGSSNLKGCERTPPQAMVDVLGADPRKTGVASRVSSYSGASGGLSSSRTGFGYRVAGSSSAGSGGSSPSRVYSGLYAGATCNGNTPYPINFTLGFKHKTHSDYSSGSLEFTRLYRSDSTWTSTSLGARWWHNYDRVLNIIATPIDTSVDITDAGGVMTIFRQVTGGTDWIAVDQDTTTTFENVYNGATLVGYLYTDHGDRREYYDLTGQLTRLESRGGEAVDLSYDGSNRLQTITAENGKVLTLSYDSSERVSSVVTPAGSFTYSYDGNGNLTTVTKPDTKTLTYHYEDTNFVNALTGITDEKGTRLETYSYDSTGRAVSTKFAGDVSSYSVAYNADGTTTTTNPLGKQTIYTFVTIQGQRKIVGVAGQASTNCVAANKAYTYDARGFMDSKTDWKGNVTTYIRDSKGLVTSMTQDAYGSANRSITTTYDLVHRLPDIITETGKITTYDYDASGRVTSVSVTDSATAQTRTTSYTYKADTVDGNGNTVLGKLASVDGRRTDVSDITTYDYDGSYRLIKTTNALGHYSEVLTFDGANRPLTTKNANGVQTTLTYDTLGRLSSSTRAAGTSSAALTSYTYDANGNVLTITSPSSTVITFVYDNAQRLTGIEDDLGNTITYTLNVAGNITKEEYKDTGTTLKYTLSQTYDELARIIGSVDANLDTTSIAYDVNSNVTSVTDGNSNATAYAFDGLDRLVNQTDALSGVTSYAMNDLDQTTGVTDPRSNTTSYSYNVFGDVIREVSPDRGTIDYTHDKAGNVTQMDDARSIVTNYSYDVLNRVSSVSYPSDSTLDQSFTYDTASGCGYSKGRLCSVGDAAGSASYVYDVLGRLTSATKIRGALSFTTSYSYDAAGVLTGITLPSGRTVSYTLNGNGQVSGVSADISATSTSLASSVTYLPFGGITGFTYGNGVTLTNTHNSAYQLTSRAIGSMLNDNYTYDNAGNITVKGADSYTLDALYRITGDASNSYSYDAIGNRLSRNGESYSYPSSSSRLSDIDSVSITTDAGGNITADTSRTYTIDTAGHVKEVKISGSVVGTYIYDASNQRSQKTAGASVTYYVYGRGGLLYGEYDGGGNMVREYVYLNGQPLAQVDSGEVLSYLHTDHLGTPRYASNTSGVQVWNWVSDAFGVGAPTGSATVNLRFAGQYWDAESDLHYNWNRYYDPETGRYISSDPIGLSGGLNTFGYVSANPAMYTDPEGLVKRKPPEGYGPSGGSENTQGKRESTRTDHEDGKANKRKGRGREKGDNARNPPRKKPANWKGPWPPKKSAPKSKPQTTPKGTGTGLGVPIVLPPICVIFPQFCGDPNVASLPQVEQPEVSAAFKTCNK